jgi:hypothetical protein
MTSMNPSVGLTQQDYENSETLAYADTDEDVTPARLPWG